MFLYQQLELNKYARYLTFFLKQLPKFLLVPPFAQLKLHKLLPIIVQQIQKLFKTCVSKIKLW